MARAAAGGKDRDGVGGGRGVMAGWSPLRWSRRFRSRHERCLPPTSRGLCGQDLFSGRGCTRSSRISGSTMTRNLAMGFRHPKASIADRLMLTKRKVFVNSLSFTHPFLRSLLAILDYTTGYRLSSNFISCNINNVYIFSILFMINIYPSQIWKLRQKEFNEVIQEQYYPWFAQYMVMKRVNVTKFFQMPKYLLPAHVCHWCGTWKGDKNVVAVRKQILFEKHQADSDNKCWDIFSRAGLKSTKSSVEWNIFSRVFCGELDLYLNCIIILNKKNNVASIAHKCVLCRIVDVEQLKNIIFQDGSIIINIFCLITIGSRSSLGYSRLNIEEKHRIEFKFGGRKSVETLIHIKLGLTLVQTVVF
ncbi:hypothetical protein Zm00014a_008782 [Zea mays]|uniref:Uncharacterized protein n=1 Tax=Zea mays TaxID=4577 RepID=A0A3L6D6U1_MAIZE|nr:hypothetical protein Zm00014a_008782 [Zea mays]